MQLALKHTHTVKCPSKLTVYLIRLPQQSQVCFLRGICGYEGSSLPILYNQIAVLIFSVTKVELFYLLIKILNYQ